MKKFTVHSYLFDIIQSVERLVYNKVAENCENRWNHNPCVGGSSPSSATKNRILEIFVFGKFVRAAVVDHILT